MIRKMRKAGYGILTIFLILGIAGYAVSGTGMKVVGMVGEDNTITDDGGKQTWLYVIGENQQGDEIAEHTGKKVEVTGTVEEASDGSKTIMIESYKLVE